MFSVMQLLFTRGGQQTILWAAAGNESQKELMILGMQAQGFTHKKLNLKPIRVADMEPRLYGPIMSQCDGCDRLFTMQPNPTGKETLIRPGLVRYPDGTGSYNGSDVCLQCMENVQFYSAHP